MLCFWLAYILTRPLGANIGDFLASSKADQGVGLGTALTSVLFLGGIAATVLYLTISRVDVIEERSGAAQSTPDTAHERSSGHSLFGAFQLLRERPLVGLIALLALEFGDEAVMAGWTAAFTIAVFPGASENTVA